MVARYSPLIMYETIEGTHLTPSKYHFRDTLKQGWMRGGGGMRSFEPSLYRKKSSPEFYLGDIHHPSLSFTVQCFQETVEFENT